MLPIEFRTSRLQRAQCCDVHRLCLERTICLQTHHLVDMLTSGGLPSNRHVASRSSVRSQRNNRMPVESFYCVLKVVSMSLQLVGNSRA
jgi:hypothetical protein